MRVCILLYIQDLHASMYITIYTGPACEYVYCYIYRTCMRVCILLYIQDLHASMYIAIYTEPACEYVYAGPACKYV